MSGFRPAFSFDTLETKKFSIVAARWNSQIMERLVGGALSAFDQHGVNGSSISVFRVPGAFELGLACQEVARTEKFDAVIALGCVIRGDTPHFDYICAETARGLGQIALQEAIPVAFGVLTVDNLDQALERSDENSQNKGREAVLTVIETLQTLEKIRDVR